MGVPSPVNPQNSEIQFQLSLLKIVSLEGATEHHAEELERLLNDQAAPKH